VPSADHAVAVANKSLWQKFVHECKHYYSGFKLLFLNVRVSSAIVWKILHGEQLTRRESKQVRSEAVIPMKRSRSQENSCHLQNSF
jgi:LETM1 and EF-hand domain-containing protein 1